MFCKLYAETAVGSLLAAFVSILHLFSSSLGPTSIAFIKKKKKKISSTHGSAETNLTSIREDAGSTHGFCGLRIQHCHELWCRSKMRLRSGIAVTVA